MSLSDAHVANLVTALLAVNQYPVDRAAAAIPGMRERGLLTPSRIAGMEHEAVIAAMSQAGYARGGYLPIVSFRLFKLMEAAGAGTLDALAAAADRGDREAFDAELAKVHGFGPSTIATAWMLWRDGQ